MTETAAPEEVAAPARPSGSFGTRRLSLEPELDARTQVELDRLLRDRLVREGSAAELAHLILMAVVGFLVWGRVSHVLLGWWGLAIATAVLVRARWRTRLARATIPASDMRRITRIVFFAVALTWGVGTALFEPQLPLQDTALILVVLSGLSAAGTATLSADATAFRLFLVGMLLPVAWSLASGPVARVHLAALALIGIFSVFMLELHRRSLSVLVAHARTTADLAVSQAETERERAALDALLAGAPVAVVALDPQSRIQRVNPRFETLFGYTAAEAIGSILDDLIVPRVERGRASRLDTRVRRGETIVEEVDRRHKDGRLIPVRVSAARVQGDAGESLFVLYDDITAERRARDALTQLASIVETSEDAIVGQSLDGRIVSWNAAAERLYGYMSTEARGQQMAVLIPPDRLEERRAIIERVGRGEHVTHHETVCLRRDGTQVAISLSLSVTKDGRGQITGFSTIARDITEQTAARVALQAASEQAERLARTRSAFLANMSHEIRTPMNAVLGLSELLAETELAPEQRHSLNLIRTSAEGLLTLLDDILDFSKIEAEHLQLESIPYDLPNVLHSITGLLAVRARERRVELLVDVAHEVPHQVRGDPTRLRQVLTNLVGNAIKFTEQGEIVVTAAREATDTPDGRARVRLAVRDTGIGIPPDKLETIFQEFSQADTSTTRKYGGTGLGLAICRRLVKLMGGDLRVQSIVGRGSEFSFTIPLPVETPAARAAASLVPLTGRRALVVDDNETNRRIITEMLRTAGMKVDEAPAGEAGLDALHREQRAGKPYQLAILDFQMPGLDGFQLAAAVRATPDLRATRILLLTSAGQRGDGQRCRELGIEGYLTKPASRPELLEAVGAILSTDPSRERVVVTRHTIEEARRRLEILIAEDNPVNQEVAATMLRRRGHAVDLVDDGRAAVAAAARKHYDLVLMDIQMPELDGFEATRAIRALPAGADLPIVALTAHALSGERERCLAQGMNGYLAKPFKSHELYAVVEAMATPGATPPPTEIPEPAAAASAAAAVLDLDGFRATMREAGAEDAVESILRTFIATSPDRMTALERAAAAGDAHALERAAHAFKSAAATIGAKPLAVILADLEQRGSSGHLDGVAADITRARQASTAVVTELQKATGQ